MIMIGNRGRRTDCLQYLIRIVGTDSIHVCLREGRGSVRGRPAGRQAKLSLYLTWV